MFEKLKEKMKEKMATLSEELLTDRAPLVQALVKEHIGPALKDIAKDDVKMAAVFKDIYAKLPPIVQTAVPRDQFVEFCLTHRNLVLPPDQA